MVWVQSDIESKSKQKICMYIFVYIYIYIIQKGIAARCLQARIVTIDLSREIVSRATELCCNFCIYVFTNRTLSVERI